MYSECNNCFISCFVLLRFMDNISQSNNRPTSLQRHDSVEVYSTTCLHYCIGDVKGILSDFFIFTLEQIIVLISHVKILQNLSKMRYKKKEKK